MWVMGDPDGRTDPVWNVALVCMAEALKRVKGDGPGKTERWLAGGCQALEGWVCVCGGAHLTRRE